MILFSVVCYFVIIVIILIICYSSLILDCMLCDASDFVSNKKNISISIYIYI